MAAKALIFLCTVLLMYAVNGMTISCPTGYLLNPHANTCIRRVGLRKSWYDAMWYCQDAGESLVTFDDWESINWLELKHRTVPGN